MYDDRSREEIIEKITQEVFDEITSSDEALSNEEIEKKINEKLDKIFGDDIEKHLNSKKSDYENIDFVEEIFENSAESAEKEASMTYDKDDDKDEDEDGDEDGDGEDGEELEEIEDEDFQPKEKEPFFKELGDLYKSELDNSINSFKNAFESLKILNKTSLFEKILIFLFLFIPALLGGMVTLILVFVILLLWQLSIAFKVLLKYLDKAENGFAESIRKLKKKITDYKNSSSFFKKLLFSNALYSVVMINGIMYLLIRGMKIPFKAFTDLDKIIANLLGKTINVVTAGLKGPSELALNNMGINAIGKSSLRGKEKGTLKSRQMKNLEKSLVKQKSKVKKVEQTKKQEQKKNQEKDKVAIKKDEKALQAAQKTQQTQEMKTALKGQENLTSTQMREAMNAAIVQEGKQKSSELSDRNRIENEKNSMAINIFDRLRNRLIGSEFMENLKNRVKDRIRENIDNHINNSQNGEGRTSEQIQDPNYYLQQKEREAVNQIRQAEKEQANIVGQEKQVEIQQKIRISELNNEYNRESYDKILQEANPKITTKQLTDLAVAEAYRLDGIENRRNARDSENLNDLSEKELENIQKQASSLKNNYPELGENFNFAETMIEYKQEKYENSNRILNQEETKEAVNYIINSLEKESGKDFSAFKGGLIIEMTRNELNWADHQQTREEISKEQKNTRENISSFVETQEAKKQEKEQSKDTISREL